MTQSNYEELAERLDAWGTIQFLDDGRRVGSSESAGAIRELLALVRELDESVKPFVALAELGRLMQDNGLLYVTAGQCRRARTAHEKAIEVLGGHGSSDQSSVAPKSEMDARASNTQA